MFSSLQEKESDEKKFQKKEGPYSKPQTKNLKNPGADSLFSVPIFTDIFLSLSEFVILTWRNAIDSTKIVENRSMAKCLTFSSGPFEPRIRHWPSVLVSLLIKIWSFCCFAPRSYDCWLFFFLHSPSSFIIHLRLDMKILHVLTNWVYVQSGMCFLVSENDEFLYSCDRLLEKFRFVRTVCDFCRWATGFISLPFWLSAKIHTKWHTTSTKTTKFTISAAKITPKQGKTAFFPCFSEFQKIARKNRAKKKIN